MTCPESAIFPHRALHLTRVCPKSQHFPHLSALEKVESLLTMPPNDHSQRVYTLAELLIEVSLSEEVFYELSKNMKLILRECCDLGQSLSDEALWERAQKQSIFLALETRTNRTLGKMSEATITKIASGVQGLLPYQRQS